MAAVEADAGAPRVLRRPRDERSAQGRRGRGRSLPLVGDPEREVNAERAALRPGEKSTARTFGVPTR